MQMRRATAEGLAHDFHDFSKRVDASVTDVVDLPQGRRMLRSQHGGGGYVVVVDQRATVRPRANVQEAVPPQCFQESHVVALHSQAVHGRQPQHYGRRLAEYDAFGLPFGFTVPRIAADGGIFGKIAGGTLGPYTHTVLKNTNRETVAALAASTSAGSLNVYPVVLVTYAPDRGC